MGSFLAVDASDVRSYIEEIKFHHEDEELILKNPNDKELIKDVLKYGKNFFGKSALFNALYHEDIQACIRLMKAGAELDREMIVMVEKLNDGLLNDLVFSKPSISSSYEFCTTKVDYFFKTYYELISEHFPKTIVSKIKGSKNPFFEIYQESEKIAVMKVVETTLKKGKLQPTKFEITSLSQQHIGSIKILSHEIGGDEIIQLVGPSGEVKGRVLKEEGGSNFILIDPNHTSKILARYQKEKSVWHIDSSIYYPSALDPLFYQLVPTLLLEILI